MTSSDKNTRRPLRQVARQLPTDYGIEGPTRPAPRRGRWRLALATVVAVVLWATARAL